MLFKQPLRIHQYYCTPNMTNHMHSLLWLQWWCVCRIMYFHLNPKLNLFFSAFIVLFLVCMCLWVLSACVFAVSSAARRVILSVLVRTVSFWAEVLLFCRTSHRPKKSCVVYLCKCASNSHTHFPECCISVSCWSLTHLTRLLAIFILNNVMWNQPSQLAQV